MVKTFFIKHLLLVKVAIHFVCLSLLVDTYYRAIIDELGGDPVKAVIHFTGIGAFNLLLITLTISPIAKWFKSKVIFNTRRLFGLYSFWYALAHVVSFIAFEVQFDWLLFTKEVVQRPYITVGMAAFLIITLLALTSLKTLKRRLKKRWQTIHNSIYLLVILVAIHFMWSVKSEMIVPITYILITLLLLLVRMVKNGTIVR